MSNIRVVSKQYPKKGRFIAEGIYNYFRTPDGLPAFSFRWQGMVFSGSKAQFVFAPDVIRIGHISDDVSRSQNRWAGFSRTSRVPSIVSSLIFGAIGAATASTRKIKGFGVFYNNEDGHLGAFLAGALPKSLPKYSSPFPQTDTKRTHHNPHRLRRH